MNVPEEVIELKDDAIGLNGWFVVDSTVRGRSCGGIRMLPGVTEREVRDLARAMTLKQGFMGVPRGGAKSGIIVEKDATDETKTLFLNRFGELLRERIISEDYIPGPDMGTSTQLMKGMYEHIGKPVYKRSTGSPRSGELTSVAVYITVEVAFELIGKTMHGAVVAVEGFGAVGSALAKSLHKAGVRVVAVSTVDGAIYDEHGLDIDDVLMIRDRFITEHSTVPDSQPEDAWILQYEKAEQLPKEQLLELPVDILCPCGRSGQINENNMQAIKALAICSGANNPVTEAAEMYLHDNDHMYLPDFVTNCGGVLGNMMEFAGLSDGTIDQVLRNFLGKQLKEIVNISKRTRRSPYSIGVEIAEKNFQRMKEADERKRKTGVLKRAGVVAYKRGFVPPWIARRVALREIDSMLSGNEAIFSAFQ
ncbi:MAG: Glu/Leu/Phe/Val dehydrogenase dimerization domain-containing protein [Candidatus Kerfeldbacteria bacterium]